MFDKDGRFKYSQVVAISNTTNGLFEIYPNPLNTDLLTIKTPAAFQNTPLQISISNAVGQKILTSSTMVSNSLSTTLSLNKLPAGIYLLEIRNEKDLLYITKLIKEK
jgi:hypothetical protein